MGSAWSTPTPQADLEQPPAPPLRYTDHYGDIVPPVCSKDLHYRYDDLYEKVYFVLHKNRECIVAFQSCNMDDPRVEPEDRFELAERVPRLYEYLDERTKACGIDFHPRIVGFLGRLPVGYMLEKLIPGPLAGVTLPPLTTFTPSTHTHKEAKGGREPVLLLYYRWALQSLSILAFLHEQSVYVMDFSYKTIWLRPDLSLALSGLVNATIPTDEWPYSSACIRQEEEIYYATNPDTCGFPELGPKIDVSDWATFVWRLMRNDHTGDEWDVPGVRKWVEPTYPLDPDEKPGEEVNLRNYHVEQLKEGKLQLLEEERLGPVFLKAWRGNMKMRGR